MTEYTDKVDQEKEFSLKQAEAFIKALAENPRDPVAVIPYPSSEALRMAIPDAYQPIEALNICVRTVLASHSTWADIRSVMRDVIDIESLGEWNKKGCRAKMWGANIFTLSGDIPAPGDIYVLGNDDPPTFTVLSPITFVKK